MSAEHRDRAARPRHMSTRRVAARAPSRALARARDGRRSNVRARASGRASDALVVVTGGTSGLGYELARCLRARGCDVIVAARRLERVDAVARAIGCDGVACDVGSAADVERLAARAAETARERGTRTTHWILAAGAVTKNAPLCDVDADEIVDAVGANLLGPLLCGRAAMRAAREDATKRVVVWNFGFSDWGRNLSRSAATHKSTKSGLSALTKVLNAEVKSMSPPIRCEFHQLSPGLALTPLLLGNGNASAVSKKIFNALAEPPSVIAEALVDRILDVPEGSTSSVEYLTPADAARRMLEELPRILTGAGGRHFDANGNRVPTSPSARYDDDGVELLPFE